ncbi:hypothetical protein B0H21DRAFT_425116 [Amylocystis lapponica]|nr:hypothetical protein B0H21DRAFT_425116 [Amylocystis lapponica]
MAPPRLALHSYHSLDSEEFLFSYVSSHSSLTSSAPSFEVPSECHAKSAPHDGRFQSIPSLRSRPLPTPPPTALNVPQSAPACLSDYSIPRPSSAEPSLPRRPRPLPPRPGPPPASEIYAPVALSRTPKPDLLLSIPEPPMWSCQQRALLSGLSVTSPVVSPLVFQRKFNRSTPTVVDCVPPEPCPSDNSSSRDYFRVAAEQWRKPPATVQIVVDVERITEAPPVRQKSRKVQVEKKGKRMTQDTKDYHKVLQQLRKLR